MLPATEPDRRPADRRLLIVGADGAFEHADRAGLGSWLRPGDLVVANDAATIPASLRGTHEPTGAPLEIRLAGRATLAADDLSFTAVAFGAGDHRMRTEDRPPPPRLAPDDALRLGPLRAHVVELRDHSRLLQVSFAGTPDEVWAGIAAHGRPIQYAHVPAPLALWDVWTPVAAQAVAFEAPSAGFLLDWRLLASMSARGVGFATLTLAAGISSTGDAALDARLPFDEPYRIPAATIAAIEVVRARGGRLLAIGTTVTRALEHSAAGPRGLHAGPGVAKQRLGPSTRLLVTDAIVTGVHVPGDSHYEVLRAFAPDTTLRRMSGELARNAYRTHEFGDCVLLERAR